jgi:ribosomal protein L3 glutamine methyltransferase
MWAEARTTLATVRDVLRFAVSRFNDAGLVFGHGTDNAYDEAAYLVLHTLRLPLERLEPFLDARLTPTELKQVLDVLEKRVSQRIPAAYLTGEAWLGDFRFEVDPRVIIPRSHIAEVLEHLETWISQPEKIGSTLDLCTGSGCLAILLAHTFPNAAVDAIDLSTDALAVAANNIALYGLEARVRALQSDLFAAVPKGTYDVIVSNPPYVTAAAMDALPPEYRREPQLALAAGNDGLDIVRRILNEARAHLKRNGLLIVEVGDGREATEAAFPDLPFTWLETSGGDDQVFLLERGQLPD